MRIIEAVCDIILVKVDVLDRLKVIYRCNKISLNLLVVMYDL